MRLIDADALRARMYHDAFEVDSDFQKWESGCWIRYKMFENAIEDAPTIDAVSVVRCKDCKHKYQEPWNCGVAVEGECEIWHSATLDNDFCSYGERKESE